MNKIFESVDFYPSLCEGLPVGIALFAKDNGIKCAYVNSLFPKFFGLRSKMEFFENFGGILEQLRGFNDNSFFLALLNKKNYYGEFSFMRARGGVSHIWVLLKQVVICEEEFLQCVFTDVSLIKKKEKVLKNRAQRDHLTGLLNRGTFQSFVESEIKREKPFAFVMVDLDNFKEINDQGGHHLGDCYLKTVADSLKKALRSDDIIGRLGGDEFAFIMKDIKKGQLPSRAQSVAKILSENFAQKEGLSCSMGIAFFSGDEALDYDSLFKRADSSLYEAKSLGKNCFCISEDC